MKSWYVTPVTEDGRADGGKWKIVQCSVGPETAICQIFTILLGAQRGHSYNNFDISIAPQPSALPESYQHWYLTQIDQNSSKGWLLPPPYLSPIRKDHHDPRHLVGKQFVNNLATQKKELPLNHDKYTNRQTQNTSSALSSLSTRGCPRQIPLLAAFSSSASYLWAIIVQLFKTACVFTYHIFQSP